MIQPVINAADFLMPHPEHIQNGCGMFDLRKNYHFTVDPFFTELVPLIGQLLSVNQHGEDLFFGKAKGQMAEEAYTLEISESQIVALASSVPGLHHAIETLRQLNLATEGRIPCCSISDKPTYRWRGFMLDCSRHFFSVKEIKKLIDVAAMHHLNVFHWHLTDDQGWRFPVRGYELLETVASKRCDIRYPDYKVSYGGFYTREDIHDVVAFAHERQMTVVPEVDSPGHVSALLAAYPELGCSGGPYQVRDQWGVFPEVLCVGNEASFAFMQAVIYSLCELFPDPYIHIGGDECPSVAWENCPRCQAKAKELGIVPSVLQGWYTMKIVKMVKDAGKVPLGWDELLDFHDGFPLPEGLVILSWRGTSAIAKAIGCGHQVIACPNTEGYYLDYKQADDPEEPGNLGVSTICQETDFRPWTENMGPDAQKLILGGQANLWTEMVCFGRHAEYQMYPRLAVIAEQLWQRQGYHSIVGRLPLEYRKLERLDVACCRSPM